MAKRKRLELPAGSDFPVIETVSPSQRARMPIADVVGEAAGHAARAELADAMETAVAEGRVVRRLPLAALKADHLVRDRTAFDEDEMEALKASLAARGQQTPIEVVSLGEGAYGLISGKRRIMALAEIGAEDVLAFVRTPKTASEAYRAMVEENEIRSDLSFFERAQVAVAAAGQGVYPSVAKAVAGLYAHAPAPRRSKIMAFTRLCERLGAALSFPEAIPEKLGLSLSAALDADAGLARRLSDALRKTPPADAAAERKVLERALSKSGSPQGAARQEVAPGIMLEAKKGRVVLTGRAVDDALAEALADWIVSHAKA